MYMCVCALSVAKRPLESNANGVYLYSSCACIPIAWSFSIFRCKTNNQRVASERISDATETAFHILFSMHTMDSFSWVQIPFIRATT